MAGELNLYVNLSAKDPRKALVESFYAPSVVGGSDIMFPRDDVRRAKLHFLEENTDSELIRPFRYVDPSGWPSVKIGAGTPDLVPLGGTFTITDVNAAQTTAAIAFDASAATVQTAIQAALTTNFSTATVADVSDSVWSINRVATGAFTGELTISTAAITPTGSTGYVINTEDGTASLSEKWQIGLARAHPILRTSGFSAFASASVNVAITQVGSSSAPKANKTFRVTWNADAYDGAVSLLFTGDTVAGTVTFAYNATEDDVVAAFELHEDVEAAGVSVIQNGAGDYLIELVGVGIKESNTPTLATSSDTLMVPVGLACTLPVNTALVTALLGSDDEVEVTLEIEIQRTSGEAETVAHIEGVSLTRDLIRNTPGMSTGLESWLSAGNGVNYLSAVTGYTGGGGTNLDGATTVGKTKPSIYVFVHSVDGLRAYMLRAGTDAESSPAIIRPDDYNASTNAVVWQSVL